MKINTIDIDGKKNSIEVLDKIISSKKYRHIKAQQLIVTDHPVVTTGNATNDILNIPIWITKWLQEKFIVKDNKTKNKIYIERGDDNLKRNQLRSIINENEIKKYLLNKDFIIIKPHEINFLDQVNYFYNADYIVSLHGAAFANIVFCKPETKIVELKGLHAGAAIENLAKKSNLNYYSITCKAKMAPNYNLPNQQGQKNQTLMVLIVTLIATGIFFILSTNPNSNTIIYGIFLIIIFLAFLYFQYKNESLDNSNISSTPKYSQYISYVILIIGLIFLYYGSKYEIMVIINEEISKWMIF